jgi:hypothetical protein
MAKAPTDIRSLARAHTDTAINTLAGIMREKEAPPAARVAAAQALLDRGWGKPAQTMEMTVKRISARELGDDELANIASGRGDGVADPQVDPSQLN